MYRVTFPGRKEGSNEHLINMTLPFPCEVHLNYPRFKWWRKGNKNFLKDRFRVLTLYTESVPLKAGIECVKKNLNNFDLILTNNEKFFEIDKVYPSICTFGGTVPSLSPLNPVFPKTFSISNLYSAGATSKLKWSDPMEFDGYKLRELFWKNKELIKIKKNFYTSSKREPNVPDKNPYPYSYKDEIMESMFTLVIENTFESNWFTEKIIDCFRTYTVPVYFGCKNITQYFNKDGMILPTSMDDAINKINSLNEYSYEKMGNAIIDNFLRAKRYNSHMDLMTRYILEGKDWLENSHISK